MIKWRLVSIKASELLMGIAFRFARRFLLDKMMNFGASTARFADYFKGFENVEAIKEIFGEKTGEILRHLTVKFTWVRSYMWVNPKDGHLTVSTYYLNNGDRLDIYLDVIHELTHVKQFMDGKELFDMHYDYVDRPTEVEAYRHVVKEARRLGLSDERICEHLKTEWLSDNDLKRLARTLNVKCEEQAHALQRQV